MSLPSRERGLKWKVARSWNTYWQVAPFAGAWIEISAYNFGLMSFGRSLRGSVDWNCGLPSSEPGDHPSLPSRERGLKSEALAVVAHWVIVAPFAGAWIEIFDILIVHDNRLCRSLRGSVDWNSYTSIPVSVFTVSLPSRERGLKSDCKVWWQADCRRSLRGSVDWN